jgi:6-phosphogluconolactonase (cycloisomerase 2 family)
MKLLPRLVASSFAAAALVVAGAVPAFAASATAANDNDGGRAVFVQTDNPNGNAVVAYERQSNGSLTFEHAYATHGKGGILNGSVVDHLASQGSLAYDQQQHVLIAVNAGSDSISVFGVNGDDLQFREVLPSGGKFPVSVAIHDHLAYVLNALHGGSVQGYALLGGVAIPLPSAHRALGLDPNATPQFTTTPGQVAFTPDGDQLIVTTKANTNAVDVLRVGTLGALAAPVVNSLPGTVPFAVSFAGTNRLVVAEAGTNAVATFDLHNDGIISPIGTAATNQAATCWIAAANGRFYVSNAGSGSLSTATLNASGTPTVTATTATDAGTVDAAATPDAQFLYVQTGATGTVDAFRVGANGSLTPVGSVLVPNAVGGEGIVAI